jgi:MinD superfamily P-loop ATPase
MVHARLGVAEENSGKLVAIVRQQAKRLAEEYDKALLIIDGPPGIGCPVISSITGTDLVLVVTEPTLSGLHDLKRVTELTGHFGIVTCVCINKFDINPDMTQQINEHCEEQHLNVIGEIPYDLEMVNAVVARMPLVAYSQGEVSQRVSQIWQRIEQVLHDNAR